MSQERRKKQQARIEEDQPSQGIPLKVIVGLAIVVLIAASVLFGWHRHTSRLDGFARCLGEKQAKMYGAFWCPHCAEQKEMFGSSFKYAPYIECGIKGSKAIEPVCTQNGIKRYPTWIFADGSRTEGEKSLEYLSEQTGCGLP
jgi:hypothetical protein